MKLQLNHIQHYPIGENGLRYVNTENTEYTFHVFELTESYVTLWDDDSGLEKVYFNEDSHLKPTFSPLSDYTDVNSKAMNELNCDVIDMIRISELANQRIGLSSVQYGVIEIMCDNHIDFNRLIESGLAIDINTLNK